MGGNHRLERFTNETPEERERRLEIQREQRRRTRQQETAEQREHRLAQRRQRRPQETGTAAKPSAGDRGTEEYFSYTGDSNSLQPLHSLLLMGHPPQSFARFCDSRISSITRYSCLKLCNDLARALCYFMGSLVYCSNTLTMLA